MKEKQRLDKVKEKKKKKKERKKQQEEIKLEPEKNINNDLISSLLEIDIINNDYPEFLNGFIDYYEVIKGKSKNTVNGYIIDISLFLKFMKCL